VRSLRIRYRVDELLCREFFLMSRLEWIILGVHSRTGFHVVGARGAGGSDEGVLWLLASFRSSSRESEGFSESRV
jgi:hypothetical protein